MLELQVAFAAFGIILAGLCPIVVAELRHVKKLESRFQATNNDQSGFTPPAGYQPAGTTYYAIPRTEPWTQKFAGTASVTTDSTIVSPSTATKVNTVTLSSPFEKSLTNQTPMATVKVVPIP